MQSPSILLALLSSLPFIISQGQDPIYGQCNKDSFKQKANANKDYPLVPALSGGPIVISGNFYIIDGCNFGIRNYTGYNFRATQIYGGFPGSTNSMLLSKDQLTPRAFAADEKFTLRTDPGAQANFDGFSEVRFFEVDTQTVIATVTLPPVSTTGSGSGTTGSGSGGASSGTGGSNKNSGYVSTAVDLATSISALFAGLMLL